MFGTPTWVLGVYRASELLGQGLTISDIDYPTLEGVEILRQTRSLVLESQSTGNVRSRGEVY